MAVTKTHPIKSTLKAAIDYILNPEKTDGKLLASSFGCGLETADIEFAWTREAAGDRGTHLGRHLIQSFAVGETTPEEAHKIGMELAGAVLGGKYEFVLTTHVDKDHLHNHLIFNAVSFVDYKKYHSNKQSYHFIRRTSDRICKEHGLSVVVPGQDKGKSYAEYTAEKQGTSYKAKLKTAIDTLIPQVKDFDELLRRLQEMGYEIKQGKYISFRAAGQERFTRTKTLGAAYTEEAIKERIKGVYVAKTKTLREDKKIRLVVDLENSIKAQQSAGYERWAKIHNLKQAAKSMNFLTENKIEYYSELESKIADIMTAHDAAAKAVKEVEQRMTARASCILTLFRTATACSSSESLSRPTGIAARRCWSRPRANRYFLPNARRSSAEQYHNHTNRGDAHGKTLAPPSVYRGGAGNAGASEAH